MKKQIMQFLKFEWRKVLIFLGFAVFTYALFRATYSGLDPEDVTLATYIIFGIPTLPLFPLSRFDTPNMVHIMFFGVLQLVYWYVFSSLIVFIYDNAKKRFSND